MRDAPKAVNGLTGQSKPTKSKPKIQTKNKGKKTRQEVEDSDDDVWKKGNSNGDAEKRMQAVVRAQGRLTKKGGVMMSSGASEFQISSAIDLQKLL